MILAFLFLIPTFVILCTYFIYESVPQYIDKITLQTSKNYFKFHWKISRIGEDNTFIVGTYYYIYIVMYVEHWRWRRGNY